MAYVYSDPDDGYVIEKIEGLGVIILLLHFHDAREDVVNGFQGKRCSQVCDGFIDDSLFRLMPTL